MSLAPLYEGPYKVVKRSPKYFRVDIGGRVEAVSLDRLKPHLGSSGVTPAVPPSWGTRRRPRTASGVSCGLPQLRR